MYKGWVSFASGFGLVAYLSVVFFIIPSIRHVEWQLTLNSNRDLADKVSLELALYNHQQVCYAHPQNPNPSQYPR